jgi:hypothetical protein
MWFHYHEVLRLGLALIIAASIAFNIMTPAYLLFPFLGDFRAALAVLLAFRIGGNAGHFSKTAKQPRVNRSVYIDSG